MTQPEEIDVTQDLAIHGGRELKGGMAVPEQDDEDEADGQD